MASTEFLFEKIQQYIEDGFIEIKDVPSYITENITKGIELRPYQVEAFNYFINYYEDERLSKNKQIHLLFHMATGSGKTLMMAGLILYLYKKGYRNFVFFVNTRNIIEKTKSNFLYKNSIKYLFSEKILINSEDIKVREVNNFQDSNPNDTTINIKLTTVQSLHEDLVNVKENSISVNDFEDNKVVFLADEAHHLNAETKKRLNKTEKLLKESWEGSITKIFSANRDNILIEFTATADLKNKAIYDKYKDKIIYDYPLLKFKESGYTKEFNNFQSTYDPMNRVILAMLLSQYRLKLFQKHSLNKKPAILLKSKSITESEQFYDYFHQFFETEIGVSNIDIILNDAKEAEDIRKEMVDFFEQNNINSENLLFELKNSFSKTHTIIMNSKDSPSVKNQKLVNELDKPDNPIRMIFTVDMLNEGWDVLNLYDIVRLYETRQGGKKISKSTISEAQLIGRGARYYPFKLKDTDKPDMRKYDDEPEHEMRICETLLYHSVDDSKYIEELRRALEEIGFEAQEVIEFEYVLKNNFVETDFYKRGKLFKNNREKKDRNKIFSLPSNFKKDVEIDLSSRFKEVSLSSNETLSNTETIKNKKQMAVKKIYMEYPHIVNKVVRQFPVFKFNRLKEYFPNLNSIKEFLESSVYAGGIDITYKFSNDKLDNLDIYKGLVKAFDKLSSNILSIKEEYKGTEKFIEVDLKNYIKNVTRKKNNPDKEGEGISQNANTVKENYRIDLSDKEWFVYCDNYGTTEEKKFVKFFSNRIEKLRRIYDEIYLMRNERSFHIYSFIDGLRFEPDYILIVKKNGHENFIQQQIFIEPKGEHLIKNDSWKQDFMLKLKEQAEAVVYHDDGNEYKIIGLPFFNDDDSVRFKEEFEKLSNI